MLDPKFIVENREKVQQTLKYKASGLSLDQFFSLNEKRLEFIKEIEALRAQQNSINQEISLILKEKKDPKEKISQVKDISSKIAQLEKDSKEINDSFKDILLRIPNVCHDSIPMGDASSNKVVRSVGELPKFEFKAKNHIDLAEKLDIIDFKRATKISGANFIIFKGQGALLERALINFMLDTHIKSGYKEIIPPYLVNRDSMTATGQLPKLEEDMYKTTEDELFLIPTAEVPVTNIHRDEILSFEELPLYYTAFTSCFRREAGSYGKDTRGLVRVHQFEKVELVKFVHPDNSYDELEKLVNDAEGILKALGLSYRVVMLASGDLSFSAAKCYDIEVYSAGMDRWLEVSSCSNFEDFQARRGNIRFRDRETKKPRFVHTLNGSGLALARIVVAIIENFQNSDGTITIPKVLRSYFNGAETIGR